MLHKNIKNSTKKCKAQNYNDALCNEMCYERGNNNNNNTSRHNLCTPHDYMADGISNTNFTTKQQNNIVSSINIDVEESNNYNNSDDDDDDHDHKALTKRLCKMNVTSIDANRHLTNQSVMGAHNLDKNNNNKLSK